MLALFENSCIDFEDSLDNFMQGKENKVNVVDGISDFKMVFCLRCNGKLQIVFVCCLSRFILGR